MYSGELGVLKDVARSWILLITNLKSARVRSYSVMAAHRVDRVLVEERNACVPELSTMNAGFIVSTHLRG
jgi:hypothetical protein